jgi:hypothetical protein
MRTSAWTGRFRERKPFKELTPNHAQLRKTAASTNHPRAVGTQHSLRVKRLISGEDGRWERAEGRDQRSDVRGQWSVVSGPSRSPKSKVSNRRWRRYSWTKAPQRGRFPLNPSSPGSPLTPTLSPSDGARETKARMMGPRGPMRERPSRGILTRLAATLSEGEEPHAKDAKGAKSWEPRNTSTLRRAPEDGLNTRKPDKYAAVFFHGICF